MHYDTSARTGRRLTAVVYLEEGWVESDGGALRIYPFPLTHVDVPPRAGTLVLFSSVACLHRVMPAYSSRFALSIWFGESPSTQMPGRPFPASFPPWVDDEAASALGFLRQPKHFSALTKVLYADEWAESVEDAFGSASETACVAAALELHYEEARRLESGMCVQLLKLLRETLPLHA